MPERSFSEVRLTSLAVNEKKPFWMRFLATVWLLSFLPALALTLYGFNVHFVPAKRYIVLYQWPALIVAVSLVAPVLVFAPRLYKKRLRLRDKISGTLTLALAMVLLPIVLLQGLLVGAPSLAHRLAAIDEVTQAYTVTEKAPAYHDSRKRHLRPCPGRLSLESAVFFPINHACGLAKSEWRQVAPGQRVYLHGDASWFGIKYTDVRLTPN